jgi:hypothetical protein
MGEAEESLVNNLPHASIDYILLRGFKAVPNTTNRTIFQQLIS